MSVIMLFAENNASNALLQNPYSQFYLSLDIDLVKIKTKSKFLKSVFSVINFIKIPAPTLEINPDFKLLLEKGEQYKFDDIHPFN